MDNDIERTRLLDLLELKDERIQQLEEAVRFYADRAQYHRSGWDMEMPVEADGGSKARAALRDPSEALEEEEE